MPQSRTDVRVDPSADVADGAVLGAGSVVWHLARVQNHALVREPAVLKDGVYIGHAVVFTNDHFPRAITPDGALQRTAKSDDVARGTNDHGLDFRRITMHNFTNTLG